MKEIFQIVTVIVVMFVILFGGLFIIIGSPQQTSQRELDAYHAWAKVTGNRSELTIEEWRSLRNYGALPTIIEVKP